MAENETWATFPSTKDNSNEDDWADFGGFETAMPSADPQPGNTTGVIPWATMPAIPQATVTTSSNTTGQQIPWATTQPFTEKTSNNLVHDSLESDKEQISELSKELDQQRIDTERASKLASDLEIKLSKTEDEKIKFKKDLENLMNRNKLLEAESNEIKEMLKIQKQSYSELQEKHEQQIKDIRQAGHDALAIIVEEYKELCKKVVIEQQEICETEFHLMLEKEREVFKETALLQQESFEKALSEEKVKNEARIQDVLETEQEKHMILLETVGKETQEEMKSALDVMVKQTVEEGKEALKKAVEKERECQQKVIENMGKVLTDEREKFKISISEAVAQERSQSQIAIDEALSEQRQKMKEMVNKCVEETKTAMADYTAQRQETASKVQQRQLVAIDLFLESARTQIKSLIENEQPS